MFYQNTTDKSISKTFSADIKSLYPDMYMEFTKDNFLVTISNAWTQALIPSSAVNGWNITTIETAKSYSGGILTVKITWSVQNVTMQGNHNVAGEVYLIY